MIPEVSLPVNGERKRTGRIRFLFLLQQTTEAAHMSVGTMINPQLVRNCMRVTYHYQHRYTALPYARIGMKMAGRKTSPTAKAPLLPKAFASFTYVMIRMIKFASGISMSRK